MRKNIIYIMTIISIIIILVVTLIYVWRGSNVLVDKRMESMVSGAPRVIMINVKGLDESGYFAKDYTCDGTDKAPLIEVDNLPQGTKALILVMYDPDAPIGTFIHWLAIWKTNGSKYMSLTDNNAIVEGRNDFGKIGYGGPCPPRGHGVHRYYFLIMALDTFPNLKKGFGVKDVVKSVKGHILGWGYIVGRYSR